jgi:hypothetical protein
MSLGIVETSLSGAPAAAQSLWLARAQSIGSTSVRLEADWARIAPSHRAAGFDPSSPADPGYHWASLDTDVRAAVAAGQTVVLMALNAPTWAEGGRPPGGVRAGTWFPKAAALGSFGRALALRYSGRFPDPLYPGRLLPRVRYFQAWNEPNLPNYLMPQWRRVSRGRWQPVSPSIYRALLNSFYGAVKAAQPGDVVLAAGTAPYGDPPATGLGRMMPVTFLREMLCLTSSLGPAPCTGPPHFDGLDHHPYSIGPTVPAQQSGDISVPDLGKIKRLLGAAQRFHRALPAGPKPLWITEIDWTSSSPDTPASQARDLARGFYALWRQGVSHVFWFALRDDPSVTDSFRNAGLYYSDGRAKPAVAAYRFPFVAISAPRGRLRLWGRAPRSGTVSIEQLVRGRWRQVLSLPTTSGGIFHAVRALGRRPRLRAVAAGVASPAWATS